MFVSQQAQAMSCEDPSLQYKLSDLKYIGKPIIEVFGKINKSTKCEVVKGMKSGASARTKCGPERAVLNPGNPQYTGVDKTGTRDDNNLGYFFCMPNLNKRELCNQMDRELAGTMDVRWAATGSKGNNDGDCKCKKKGDSRSEEMSCPFDPEPLQTGKSTSCNVADAVKGEDGQCRCIVGNEVVKDGGTCESKPTPPVATPNVDPADFDECLAEVKAAKDLCSENGKLAIDKCSKEAPEINKNISEAQRVLSIGLDAVIAKNAGTGALAACAKMGAAGTSVIEALSLLRESCKKELDSCKKSCEQAGAFGKKTEAEYIAECKAKFESQQPPKLWTNAHETAFKPMVAQYASLADNSEKFCKGDVKKSEGQLDDFLQELALSVQKADVCKCQLTAANVSGESCDAVVGPLTCIQNVNQPGCSFSSVGCAPGSTLPNCVNPISAINPNGSGINMPASGFAGPGFGSSGGAGGTNSGKTDIGAGDLSGLYDETRPSGSGTATADAGSPFGAAGAAGSLGGGGAGGGGGAEGGGGGGDEEKDKGGLSGLFQSAKGGIASLFGGGADNKGSAVKKPDNKAYKNDVNGFRPKAGVRGMANSNEFGSKNRDIWKTMNERYNDQYHTFITVENPQK